MSKEQEGKTKEEILWEVLEVSGINRSGFKQEWGKELYAMEIYAKQEARTESIAFAEFIGDMNVGQWGTGRWRYKDEWYTTEQLYQLFIEQKQ